jgi:hypothetical protein
MFIGQFGPAYQKAAERTGLPWAELKAETDPDKTLSRLLDAAEAKGKSELQTKYDSLKSMYDALRAKSGADGSPESGGTGSSNGAVPRTVEELERMGLNDFERNFDKILATLPNR